MCVLYPRKNRPLELGTIPMMCNLVAVHIWINLRVTHLGNERWLEREYMMLWVHREIRELKQAAVTAVYHPLCGSSGQQAPGAYT